MEQNVGFESAFFTYTAWYNGAGEEIDRFIEWLDGQDRKRQYGHDHVFISPEKRKEFKEIDTLIGCLVIMFGDYGTSPRGGWIEQVDNALNWLRYVRMYWADDK